MILGVGQPGRASQTMKPKPIGVARVVHRRVARSKRRDDVRAAQSFRRLARVLITEDSRAGAALIEWDLKQVGSGLEALQNRLGTGSPVDRVSISTSTTGATPGRHARVAQ